LIKSTQLFKDYRNKNKQKVLMNLAIFSKIYLRFYNIAKRNFDLLTQFLALTISFGRNWVSFFQPN